MLHQFINIRGLRVVTGTFPDLKRFVASCRAHLHMQHGPDEGERQFRRISMLEAMRISREGRPD